MADTQDRKLKIVRDPYAPAPRTAGAVLSEIFKALKVLSFYPKGHPLLAESIQHAYRVMAEFQQGRDLSFGISRQGFLLADLEEVGNTPMSIALAEELFVRRVQRITFLSDLSLEDIERFLSLLTLDPRRFTAGSGIDDLMKRRGITTIWVNELDMAVILANKAALEAVGPAEVGDDQEASADSGDDESQAANAAGSAMLQAAAAELQEIIRLMDNEPDDQRYLQLADLAISLAEKQADQGHYPPLANFLFALLTHYQDGLRGERQRHYAHSAIIQIATDDVLKYLLTLPEQRDFQDAESLVRLLLTIGGTAIKPIISRLSESENLYARKFLANALLQIGEPAIPFLAAMFTDERWYVVRNSAAILGEIGAREGIKPLKGAAYHTDNRVRKEAIRSLAKIGGAEAEAVLIGLLTTRDKDVRIQAIFSLGIMKSQLALQPLLDIVATRDFFMDQTDEKREAMQAVGRLGDRRATQFLLDFVTRPRWFTWKRMDELKIAAIQAISQLGDEAALATLKKIAERRGPVGAAGKEALEVIERVTD